MSEENNEELNEEELNEEQQQVLQILTNTVRDGVSSGRLGRRSNQSFYDKDTDDFLRDFKKILGYPDELKFKDLKALYERTPIAGRIVDKPVEDSWAEEPEVVPVDEQGEPLESEEAEEFREAYETLVDEKDLNDVMMKADRLQRQGQFGVIFIGLSDASGDDGQAQPAPSRDRNGTEAESMDVEDDLLWLQPFSEGETDIHKRVEEQTNERFGLVKEYKIETFPEAPSEDEDNEDGEQGILVHHSRVVHLTEETGPSEVRGRPALRRVYNRLMDLQKVLGPSAESLYQLIAPRYWFKLAESFDTDNVDQLAPAWKDFVHNIKDMISTEGVEEIETLGGEDIDPSPTANMLFKVIAADLDIPQSVLFGNETGERATQEDRRLWYSNMEQRQKNHNAPNIVRPTIDRLQQIGVLPDINYKVEWPNLFEQTPEEEANVMKTKAQAVAQLAGNGPVTEIAPMPVLREEVLGLPRDFEDVESNSDKSYEEVEQKYEQVK